MKIETEGSNLILIPESGYDQFLLGRISNNPKIIDYTYGITRTDDVLVVESLTVGKHHVLDMMSSIPCGSEREVNCSK